VGFVAADRGILFAMTLAETLAELSRIAPRALFTAWTTIRVVRSSVTAAAPLAGGGAMWRGTTESVPLPSSNYPIIRDMTAIMRRSKLLRMDNVGIVVDSLDNVISFLTELGLKLEGRAMVEGEWAGRVTGLGNQCVEIAMMVTPDGHSRLELSRFHTPSTVADHRNAPVNAFGYLRPMFTVSDIDETLVRLRKHGAQLVGEVVQYEDSYRLCYIRGPEGLLIGLAEPLGRNRQRLRANPARVSGWGLCAHGNTPS